jgi:hypothetical protein
LPDAHKLQALDIGAEGSYDVPSST